MVYVEVVDIIKSNFDGEGAILSFQVGGPDEVFHLAAVGEE